MAGEEESDWKEIGNRAFQEKKYEEAVTAYSAGLKATPSDVSLLSNRALNYLNLEFYTLALSDAEAVLKAEPNHVKGLYRKVKALLGGKKYRDAVEFILKDDHKRILNSYAAGQKLGEVLLGEAERFLEQELTGNYNMGEILKKQSFEHSVADFTGPIALETFQGRGRGMVVTEKVEAGQLLIGSKAFAFIVERKYRKMRPPPPPTPSDSNESTPRQGEEAAEAEDYAVDLPQAKASLVQAIADKVKKCPEETRVMYTLFAGAKFGHLELDESMSTVDLGRISKIVDCNALAADGRLTYEYKELMYGLWLLPSFINHSCLDGNVKWHMHGDFLTVIAIKDIEPGEELRMSYVSPAEPWDSRQKLLSSYELRCECSLCTFQRRETPGSKEAVESVVRKYEDLLGAPGSMVSTETSELEAIVREMEEIHPDHLHLCPFILEPYKLLARRYFRAGNYEKSIQLLEKGRGLILGTDFTSMLLTFTTNIISAHLKNKDKRKAIEWVETMRNDVRISYGSPVEEVLQVIAPDLIAKLKVEKISISEYP